MQLRDIPNILTISRMVLVVPISLFLLNHLFLEALVIFFIAGLSDGLDGFLAKKFKWRSEFGAILDPLADKFLLIVIYITCSVVSIIPWWLTVFVVARDLVIISGVSFYYKKIDRIVMSPSIVSKINTFMQIFLLLVLMLNNVVQVLPYIWLEALFYGVFTTTAMSGVDYFWTWGNKFFRNYANKKSAK